jgi:hypothetical protein
VLDIQGEISMVINWSGQEADQSPPSGANVKKYSTVPHVLMVWCN